MPGGTFPCTSCGTPCRASDRFCSQCGLRDPAASTDSPTEDTGSYSSMVTQDSVSAATHTRPLRPGDVFARRYRIERLLGEGGMGHVYLAVDTTIFEPIALKFVAFAHRSDPRLIEQFKRELKLARKIRHRNVVASFHLAEAEGHVYITQEYIDAESLSSRLQRTGALSDTEALRILRQVLCGLKAAHDLGIVHRDIKSSNILVHKDGMAFITDFGLAMSTAAAAASRPIVGGTPQYMAPELFRGAAPSPSTDLYACGVLLFHMLTRKFPSVVRSFRDSIGQLTYATHRPDPLPEALEVHDTTRQLYEWLVASDPRGRPQQAVDVVEMIDGVLALDAMSIRTERPIAVVAEANDDVRMAARALLETLGYHVETAHNAAEAINLAFSVTPALVVLDSNMKGGEEIAIAHDKSSPFAREILPQHPGLGLCCLLQHDARLKRVPILVVADELDPGLRSAFMLMGAAEVIPKPFTEEVFAAGMRNARHTASARSTEL